MKKVCLIPARSGSKGLKNKNMLFLAGKPLLFHTIEAALESGEFAADEVYVSTDSAAYAALIRETGVNVLLRKPELAEDTTSSYEVIADFLAAFQEDVLFALLQPTSPLRTGAQLQAALRQFKMQRFDHFVSVSKAEKSPELFSERQADGSLPDLIGIDRDYRRQTRKSYYYPNGAIYLSTKQAYLRDQSFFTAATGSYVMDKQTAVDIDDKADFYQAVGIRYFDYQAREINNQALYTYWFAAKAETRLQADWLLADSRGEQLSLAGVSNLAIGGVTAATVASQLPTLLTKQVPNRAAVALGVNDLITGYSPAETAQQIEQIIRQLTERGAEVVLVEVIYTLYVAAVGNAQIAELNKRLCELAEKWDCLLVDPNERLANTGQLLYDFTTDGLHFSEAGNAELLAYYQAIFQRRTVR